MKNHTKESYHHYRTGDATLEDSSTFSGVDPKSSGTLTGLTNYEIPFVHEYPQAGRSVIRKEIEIPPSSEASKVVATSMVIVEPGQHTPEYIAVIRRRLAHKLIEEIENLGKHAKREDFDVPASLVLQSIKEALQKLEAATTEGNAREVFRQLRDSMLDGRWKDYKLQAVRQVSSNILSDMGKLDRVDSSFYRDSYRKLKKAGANPRAIIQITEVAVDGED